MIVDPSKETLPLIQRRNTNNNNNNSKNSNAAVATTTAAEAADFLMNSHENQLKYNFVVSSNANYQDQNLLAVYSTMNKLNSNPQMNQQLFNSNNTKTQMSTNMNRLKTNSPLPVNSNHNAYLLNSAKPTANIDRSSSFSKYQNGSSSPTNTFTRKLTNDTKKYQISNSTSNISTKPTHQVQQQQQSGSPIISILNKPIFSNIFILNSSNTPNHQQQNSSSTTTGINQQQRTTGSRSPNKIQTDASQLKPQSPTAATVAQQQNFYNFTSKTPTSQQVSSQDPKQPQQSKEKSSLSNYFTNLLNQSPQQLQQQAQQSSKKLYSQNKLNGRSTTPIKNLSRNDTNASNMSNYNNYNTNSNLSMILALNKFNTLKHSNSFNYKFTNHYHHQTTSTPTGTITDNEIISRMLNRTNSISNTTPNQLSSGKNISNNNDKYYDSTLLQELDVLDSNNDNKQMLMNIADVDLANSSNANDLIPKTPNKQMKLSNDKQNILKLINQNKRQTPENLDDAMNLIDSTQNNIQLNDEQQKTKILHSILHSNNNSNSPNGLVKQPTQLLAKQDTPKTQKNSDVLSKSVTPQKRANSARTFVSRDINDSYAYNDVKKYIEENDLMSAEKAEFIKLWVKNVNLYLKDLEQTVT